MHKLGRYILLGLAASLGFCVISCKDDDDEYLYLTGTPEFELPEYVVPGQTLTMSASGVTDDDDLEVDYYWYTSYQSSVRDTTITFTFDVPTDTLADFTVTCTGYREGYYGSSTTKTFTIVSSDRANGSIKGRSLAKDDFSFVDPRDGNDYYCTKIGNTEWFKENLAYEGYGKPKSNSSATAKVFGHYYTWNEALKACPDGWRLPSGKDWTEAAKAAGAGEVSDTDNYYGVAGKFMGNIYFNGDVMWEYWPEVKTTDDLGLDVMPVGYATLDSENEGTFAGYLDYAALWTSDEKDEDMAFYRYIYVKKPDLMLGSADKSLFMASVRCVRDAK